MKTHAAKEQISTRLPAHVARKISLPVTFPSHQGEQSFSSAAKYGGITNTITNSSGAVQRKLQQAIESSPRQMMQSRQLSGMFPQLLQRKAEKEELQMKVVTRTLQRQELKDKELLQGKFDSLPTQLKVDPVRNTWKWSQSPIQKCIGVEGEHGWDTYSSWDNTIRLDRDTEHGKIGEGGALTVFKTGGAPFYHRIVCLEWFDGMSSTGKEFVAHLATPALAEQNMSKIRKIGMQVGSVFPWSSPMTSVVERLPFDNSKLGGKPHKTVAVDEGRKEAARTHLENEIGRQYTYNLATFSCKDWARQIAPEAIV